MSMDEQNLTKKEKYDLEKEYVKNEKAGIAKVKRTKRILLWGLFLLVLAGAAWGLFELAGQTSPEIEQAKILDTVSAGDWVTRNREAGVTLIEYGDFQCPACGAFHPLVKKLLENHADNFQFAYRHFPLQQHPHAKPAGYAAEAAGLQGKFWEMYDLIFANQNKWTGLKDVEETFMGYAESLGLNMEQFKKDYDSDEVKDEVDRDNESGFANKVNATPTFYLNGVRIQPRSYEDFESQILNAASQPEPVNE